MAEELKEEVVEEAAGNPYKIDYSDSRFKDVEISKDAALNDLNNAYGGMINEADNFYKSQIDATKEWEKKQSQLQQEQTDFAIEQIEQQREQAQKDYTKEQSGAYADWQKQSNQYGVNAERMAAQGMQNTGFSESSQVGMYNTYQNRIAAARESVNKAVLNYDNAMKDAILQNNSALAQIAFNSLQQQLELSLQGFQHKNQLVLDQVGMRMDVENQYYNRYQDVLNQINTENSLEEQIRQFNEQMAEEQRQFNFYNKLGEFAKKKSSGKSSSSSKKTSSSSTINKNTNSGLSSDTAQSILDLGAGPISANTLAGMVNSGKVSEVSTGGKTTFEKNEGPKLPYTWQYL